jgi:hypothetical protein
MFELLISSIDKKITGEPWGSLLNCNRGSYENLAINERTSAN